MKVIVHEFRLSDSDDPAIYAAQPIWEWQQTEAGKWVMQHSMPEPSWNMRLDPMTYGYTVVIVAELQEHNLTFFNLKYKNNESNRL